MAENRRSFINFLFCSCVFTIILWNNIKPSDENEFIANYSNILLEDHSDYETKSLPLSHTRRLQFASADNRINHSSWDVVHNTSDCLVLSNIPENGISDLIQLLSKFNKTSELQTLILNNITTSWTNFIRILQIVWHTSIEYFNIFEMKLLSDIKKQPFNYTGTSMKALIITNVSIEVFYFSQDDLYRIFSEMNITALTISDSKIIHMLCPSKQSQFRFLSFSNNDLTDMVFQGCNKLDLLETLILQRNQLKKLSKVSSMTSKMKSLKHLDISRNLLYCDENANHCHWVGMLAKLNLSSNKLTDSVFGCLPISVQILDLQNNQIRTVPKDITELKALKELNIAFNRLTELPGCSHFRGLQLLNIEENSILTPSSDFFHSCQNIRELRGGHNPFQCSCELQDFVNFEKKSLGRLVGWPESYVCEYPDGLKGTQLKDFQLSELSCNTTLLLVIALVVTVVVVAVTSFLCIYFDVMWYLKMMWQWTQTKRRVRNNHPEDLQSILQFHAFISYSERDSLWVKNHLIPNLEKEDGSVQICLHERNFIPGKSIIENIINSIEKSHKSIFVLSPNFVQSEWCHYELYFAHHKLFSESSDSLILILLEPIPQYLIPARYHKLKALMAKRTYLEWPKEKSKHGLFWANLKATINSNLPISTKVV
ncbi:toll-like receptor 6 [Dermochelys coriacea]|uniref:toll-like receptor 6 n=1 Tax=Dermochelys coriacea TaxID=27794 RepID=UPI0018E7A918|nr:toll-like receptor 6 [Dermochelys coriacea]XP_043369892.1 toll-like receptor 6 [Dermochelys coriacea]